MARQFLLRILSRLSFIICTISIQMALQPGVGLGLLYNIPPGLSIPCSVSTFVYTHLSQVHGHVIQPSHFWPSSSSCCIQLSVHLFWDCGVLHSVCMTKPSYSLAFNKPDSVLPLDYGIICTRVGTLIVATIYLQLIQNRYMFRSFTVLQCSHQHCVQPVASDVEVVGYL